MYKVKNKIKKTVSLKFWQQFNKLTKDKLIIILVILLCLNSYQLNSIDQSSDFDTNQPSNKITENQNINWISPDKIHSACDIFRANNLIDGDINTLWHHWTYGEEHWVIIDLGQSYLVDKLRSYHKKWETTNPIAAIYVSDDLNDFESSLGSLPGYSTEDSGWKIAELINKRGRYVKLVTAAVKSPYLNEIEIGIFNNKSLVGYWNFNEQTGKEVIDSSKYKNHGYFRKDFHPTRVIRDKSDKALYFKPRKPDGVIIPHSKSLNITEEITIMAWFKLDPGQINDKTGGNIITKGHKDKGSHWYLTTRKYNDSLRLAFSICKDPKTKEKVTIVGETNLHPNHWYHVTATYSRKYGLQIYLNGIPDAVAVSYDGGILGEDENGIASDVYIGLWGLTWPLNEVTIDDVRIYNYKVPGEIIKNFANLYYKAYIDYTQWPQNKPVICIEPQRSMDDKMMTILLKKGDTIINQDLITDIPGKAFTIGTNYPVEILNLSIQLIDKKTNDPISPVRQSFKTNIVINNNKSLKNLNYFSFYTPFQKEYNPKLSPFQKVNMDIINTFKKSPYTGFNLAVMGANSTNEPLTYSDVSDQIKLLKDNLTSKHIWPMVFINRIVGSPKQDENGNYPYTGIDGKTECPEYFDKINIMDIYNDAGALEDYYKIFKLALRIAKETGAPGVFMEPEAYNNYGAYHIKYLADQYKVDENEIINQLEKIGSDLADMVDEVYENEDKTVILWFYFIANGRSRYHNSIGYIARGILKRAQEKSYRLKVIDGYTGSYLYKSLEHAKYLFIKKYGWGAKLLDQFGDYFEMGSVICPFESIDKLVKTGKNVWLYKFYGSKSKIKGINDFKPIFNFLFNTSNYVWIYGATSANYIYKKGHYEVIDKVIKDCKPQILEE